jgi:hypothetical protein
MGIKPVRMIGTRSADYIRASGHGAAQTGRTHRWSLASPHRPGYTLTILREERDRRWRLARDANLLTAEQ